jgi:hypothetical protein
MGISFIGAIRLIASFIRAFFLPDKRLEAVNDSGEPLVLGDPNRGYNIRHITPDGVVYAYKGNGWYNSETGKTICERGKKDKRYRLRV